MNALQVILQPSGQQVGWIAAKDAEVLTALKELNRFTFDIEITSDHEAMVSSGCVVTAWGTNPEDKNMINDIASRIRLEQIARDEIVIAEKLLLGETTLSKRLGKRKQDATPDAGSGSINIISNSGSESSDSTPSSSDATLTPSSSDATLPETTLDVGFFLFLKILP